MCLSEKLKTIHHFKFHPKNECVWKWAAREILMQFDRLYFSLEQTEAEIWALWPFGPSRALPDIWTGKTHLGSVLRWPWPRGPGGPAISTPLLEKLHISQITHKHMYVYFQKSSGNKYIHFSEMTFYGLTLWSFVGQMRISQTPGSTQWNLWLIQHVPKSNCLCHWESCGENVVSKVSP